MKLKQTNEDPPFRHLAELEALNRALIEYHIPQKPEPMVETAELPEVKMPKIEIRRKSPLREARDDSSRF